MDSQKYDNIRRSKERIEQKPEPPKNEDNFRFIGWGGVVGATLVVRTEK